MKKTMFGIVAVIGLLLMIGTAGASDLGNITLGQSVIQSVAGLLMFWVGIRGCGAIEN